MDIPFCSEEIPVVTADQMAEVDRAMTEDFRIELIQMMEHAGRTLARLACARFLEGEPVGKRVAVLAGTGGNGGGALVCARMLANWGTHVHVYIARDRTRFAPVPAHQLDTICRMKVPVALFKDVAEMGEHDLIVDGIIGYSLKGVPEGPSRDLIAWANIQKTNILALDVPSGVDASTGTVFNPAIRAAATMTLALPKKGLTAPGAKEHVGELYLADIGVPPSLYTGTALGLAVKNLFSKSDIIKIDH